MARMGQKPCRCILDHMRLGFVRIGVLAIGLYEDKQYQEALAVLNQCLQINPTNLDCITTKAESLFALGHLRETKSLVEQSLTLAAITELDTAAKEQLRRLLTRVNEGLKNQPPSPPRSSSVRSQPR
jgi:tetratricopeptide (TPR) repeat protein